MAKKAKVKLKEYNPFTLDTDKDEPSWQNDNYKFFIVDKGENCKEKKQIVIALAVKKSDDSRRYVLFYGGQPCSESSNLEEIFVKKDILTHIDFTK